MTPQDLISTAAHLHVAMRRKMGRVTDTEWMASDFQYAQAMSSLALRHAEETQDTDLHKWATRLADGWTARQPRPAPVIDVRERDSRAAKVRTPTLDSTERYVVGLRC
ncbi:MAG TPA: hypothetical protein VFY35_13190 [Burkholderiaceae bacterium]|nr:hypothetical protein [Burkholderiaceae bacterium]